MYISLPITHHVAPWLISDFLSSILHEALHGVAVVVFVSAHVRGGVAIGGSIRGGVHGHGVLLKLVHGACMELPAGRQLACAMIDMCNILLLCLCKEGWLVVDKKQVRISAVEGGHHGVSECGVDRDCSARDHRMMILVTTEHVELHDISPLGGGNPHRYTGIARNKSSGLSLYDWCCCSLGHLLLMRVPCCSSIIRRLIRANSFHFRLWGGQQLPVYETDVCRCRHVCDKLLIPLRHDQSMEEQYQQM